MPLAEEKVDAVGGELLGERAEEIVWNEGG